MEVKKVDSRKYPIALVLDGRAFMLTKKQAIKVANQILKIADND